LTRRRFAKGLPGVGGRNTTVGSFVQLLALPTLFTMFISGVWHGAGYLFMLWGLVHGVYLTINHAWRTVLPKRIRSSVSYGRVMRPLGWLITFFAVAVAMVLFRSPTVPAATEVLAGMVGLNGLQVPETLWSQLGPLAGLLEGVFAVTVSGAAADLIVSLAWTIGLLIVALFAPNTLELTSTFEPAVGYRVASDGRFGFFQSLRWEPSAAWGVALAAVAVIAAYRVGSPSEFLYWQF
jgi:hypothetical protein